MLFDSARSTKCDDASSTIATECNDEFREGKCHARVEPERTSMSVAPNLDYDKI